MPNTTGKIKVALVGAGSVSRYHARALQSLDFVEIVGVSDINVERAVRLANEFDIPVFSGQLADLEQCRPDVVHILTPPDSHCKLAVQALAMGSHVFVEKPMAPTTSECDQMIAAARKAGRILSVNHSARLDPVILRALELVRRGACGEVLAVDFLRSSEYSPYAGGAEPPQFRQGSYPFQDLGTHGLCLMEAFLGRIDHLDVQYFGTGRTPGLAFDEWHAQVRCQQGVGRIYLSWNVRPMQNELIIHGTRGVMHVDCYLQICTLRRSFPAPKQVQRVYYALANSAWTIGAVLVNSVRFATRRLPASPAISSSIRAFYFALRANVPPPISAQEGRRMVECMAGAIRAADTEKRRLLRAATNQPAPARVLVTGGSGFVGRSLIRRLLRNGESPRVLLRRSCPELEKDPRIDICRGDLGNPEDVDRAVSGVDVVYHLGAATQGSWQDYECATVCGTRNIIDACLRHRVKRLVHMSSLGVLDHAGHSVGTPVLESSPLEPHPERRGNYSRSKLIAETMVVDAIRDRKLPALILRPGQIFGPGASSASPTGAFVLGNWWIVYGRGKCLLDLVYVEDVVDALLRAGTKSGISGRIFHLVASQQVTQREYINHFRRPGGERVKTLYLPKFGFLAIAAVVEMLGGLLGRSFPISRHRVRSLVPLANCDCTAAREALDWHPTTDVRERLIRAVSLTYAPADDEPCRPNETSKIAIGNRVGVALTSGSAKD